MERRMRMEPSRELDALVAEKVMNWDNVHCLSGGNIPFGRPDDDYNRAFPSAMYSEPVPLYSTDIAAAWTVDKPGWLWEFQEAVGVLSVTLYTSPALRHKAMGVPGGGGGVICDAIYISCIAAQGDQHVSCSPRGSYLDSADMARRQSADLCLAALPGRAGGGGRGGGR